MAIKSFARTRSRSRVTAVTPIARAQNGREQYRVILCDMNGVRIGELQNAVISNITYVLNDDHTMEFSIPSTDPKITLVKVPQGEVQVWKGRILLFWGVIVRAQSTSRSTSFQCVSLSWYFRRRHVGTIPRARLDNWRNGSFEQGLLHWNYQGHDGAGFTYAYHGLTPALVQPGRSLRLSTNNWQGADAYAFNNFQHNVPAGASRPTLMTVVGWQYVDYYGAASVLNAALWIGAYQNGVLVTHAFSKVTATSPQQTWTRHEVAIEVPPSATIYDIQVRAYALGIGTIYWDEIDVSVDKRLAFKGIDQATMVQELVRHAQDTTLGKTTLNIGTECPATGIRREREYLWSNHEVIRDLIDEFPTLANGLDWDIRVTETRRTFTTYRHHGVGSGKGTVLRNLVLEMGRNLMDYTVSVDGEQTANVVAVLAAGEGSDREEGSAKDAGALGGLTLEKVYNATPGSAFQSLQAQAERGLRRYKVPVTIPQVTTFEGATKLIGAINTGDIVPVRIKHGWINVNAYYRVLQIDLNPQTDQMTLTLAPHEDPV